MDKRYLRPSWLIARLVNPLVMRLGLGGTVTLAVRGRRSGEWRSVPVNVIEHVGQRYLVAPRGDTHWARNLRSAGAGELRSRRGKESFKAVEVPVEERGPILAAYRRVITATEAQFAELPEPAQHPTFRIVPA